MKTKLLSQAQRKCLQNKVEGKSIDNHVYGESMRGGYAKTLLSLRSYGLIEEDGFGITEAGRKALKTGKVEVP